MVVLNRACIALAVGLAGCYAPDTRDCTVTCSGATDCADGQHCVGGYCIANDETMACSQNPETPDAPVATTMVHIMIGGHGHVVLGGSVVCDSVTGSDNCTITVPQQLAHAQAVAATDAVFETWMSPLCTVPDQPTCDFTPPPTMISIGVQFK
jgi:hypothetical protein